MKFEAIILAGGKSSRMGRDKAKLRLGGRTMTAWIRSACRQAGLEVRLLRKDRVPGCGPLGGISTGLETTRADAVVFLSCDMPFISRALLSRLMLRARRSRRALFCTDTEGAGFPCVLRVKHQVEVKVAVGEGEYSLQSLVRRLGAIGWVLPRSLRPERLNINTPADLALARKRRERLQFSQ